MQLKYLLSDSNRPINSKYIVFHTKCRFFKSFNYNLLKDMLTKFYNKFRCKYDIIILGEKNFPYTIEVEYHGITTIYNELTLLKQNNNVIDMTTDSIYDNLDIKKYKMDLNTIINAEYNILVGYGGQLCSCLAFNFDKTISYVENYIVPFHNNLKQKLYENIENYFQWIYNNLNI
jgi:hypothetical protein